MSALEERCRPFEEVHLEGPGLLADLVPGHTSIVLAPGDQPPDPSYASPGEPDSLSHDSADPGPPARQAALRAFAKRSNGESPQGVPESAGKPAHVTLICEGL